MLRFMARSLSGSRSYPLFTNPHLSVLEARAGRQQVFRRWASKERKSPGGQKVTGHWSGALKKYLRVIPLPSLLINLCPDQFYLALIEL